MKERLQIWEGKTVYDEEKRREEIEEQ